MKNNEEIPIETLSENQLLLREGAKIAKALGEMFARPAKSFCTIFVILYIPLWR